MSFYALQDSAIQSGSGGNGETAIPDSPHIWIEDSCYLLAQSSKVNQECQYIV
jgi:hypothetical protein